MRSLSGAVAALLVTGLVVAAQPVQAQASAPGQAAGPSSSKPERMFQEMAAACAVPLADTGKPMKLKEPLDDAQRGAAMAAIFLALHDPSGNDAWPENEIAAAPPCPVARFAADEMVWTIHGGGAGLPVRWVQNGDKSAFFWLMKAPGLADAGAWERGGRQGLPAASAPPIYFLLSRLKGMNFIVQAYDGPPSSRRMAEDVAAVVEKDRNWDLVGVHDAVGDVVTLYVETTSGTQVEIFRPQDITGGAVAGLMMPDGHFFTFADDGYVMRGSGFTCRETYGPFKRDLLGILNPTDSGLDLACYLTADSGQTTVFVTHAPEASQDKSKWEQTLREEEAESGVAMKLGSPPQGPKKQIQAGRSWIDKAGLVRLIVFLRRGDYVYEIRQAHPREGLEGANAALLALLEQIDLPDARTAEGWKARR